MSIFGFNNTTSINGTARTSQKVLANVQVNDGPASFNELNNAAGEFGVNTSNLSTAVVYNSSVDNPTASLLSITPFIASSATTTALLRIIGFTKFKGATSEYSFPRMLCGVSLIRASGDSGCRFNLDPANAGVVYYSFTQGTSETTPNPVIYTHTSTSVSQPPMHIVVDILNCTKVVASMSFASPGQIKCGYIYNAF